MRERGREFLGNYVSVIMQSYTGFAVRIAGMATKPKIWASYYQNDPRLIKSISTGLPAEIAVANRIAFSEHDKIDSASLPKYLYWDKKDFSERQKSSLPALFSIESGHKCISKRFKQFLEEFDLEDSQFFPVPLLAFDRKTPRPDEIYLFNLTTKKDTIIPEQCDGIEQRSPKPHYRQRHQSKQLVVKAPAVDGADIWKDPKLMTWVFFSDRIVRAMKGQKFGTFAFKECAVI